MVILIPLAAFIDRADIVQYVGLPKVNATYQILFSCLREMMRCGIVETTTELKCLNEALLERATSQKTASVALLALCESCAAGPECDVQRKQCIDDAAPRSGRSLRRLPLLAHARHFQGRDKCSLQEMIEALSLTVEMDKKK